MTGELERRRTARVVARTDRQLAKVNQEAELARHRLRMQLAKEYAAVTAICGCADAVDAVPSSAPPGLKAMAERIARGSSRLIGRMVR